MEKYLDVTGRTIDEAVASALEQLGLDRDSVSVEVLEKPKAGFLGLGGASAKVRVLYQTARDTGAAAFLEGLLRLMEVDAKIETSVTSEGHLEYNMTGEKMGILIGRRGDTLDALQHLAAAVANRGDEPHVRVTLDTEGYRQKREASIIELANRTAEKAVKYRRNMTLEPMNSYARRVIHTALQDNPNVTTHSVGAEPNRRVVIAVSGGDRQRTDYGRPGFRR